MRLSANCRAEPHRAQSCGARQKEYLACIKPVNRTGHCRKIYYRLHEITEMCGALCRVEKGKSFEKPFTKLGQFPNTGPHSFVRHVNRLFGAR